MSVFPSSSPSSGSLFPAVPSLNSTYGAVLLGSYFGLMMYGFNLHQAYRYARLFPTDQLFLKAVVVAVLILETFHTVLCMHMSYYYLAANYFDPLALLAGSWSIDMLPISAGVTIIACQTFFVRRVYHLLGRRYTFIVIIVNWVSLCPPLLIRRCLIVSDNRWPAHSILCRRYSRSVSINLGWLGLVIVLTAPSSFIQPTFAKYEHVTWLISVGFGVALAADGILTTVLILCLRQSRTGVRRTDSVVDVLILYAITTGLLTSVFNTLAFLFALIQANNLIYVGINIVASKLYATSLFAALNSRVALTQQGNGASTAIYGATGAVPPGAMPRVTFPTIDRWSVAAGPPTGTSDTALHDVHTRMESNERFEETKPAPIVNDEFRSPTTLSIHSEPQPQPQTV
ncbi:hypothetical protein GY45DRAFT_1365298 [Cubamyces sp. BRFM 1775]|nr:hypothetical protein GY45DRAFT_1365298 [Cubamyces sp. BRFM 1775]